MKRLLLIAIILFAAFRKPILLLDITTSGKWKLHHDSGVIMLRHLKDKILRIDILTGKDADSHLAHIRLDKIKISAVI